ncbi:MULTISPECIES: hypothetical protein [unclassified Kitasatospora]|uniref:hypothetical protein n=1 Tax=unclassified Kitasatospora TaxID=2633591 RepID=UPI0033C9639D
MDLAFVQSGLLEQFLEADVISAAEVAALLKRRGLLDGTPMFLDEETQMPVPPLCEYGKYLSTALLDETTPTRAHQHPLHTRLPPRPRRTRTRHDLQRRQDGR